MEDIARKLWEQWLVFEDHRQRKNHAYQPISLLEFYEHNSARMYELARSGEADISGSQASGEMAHRHSWGLGHLKNWLASELQRVTLLHERFPDAVADLRKALSGYDKLLDNCRKEALFDADAYWNFYWDIVPHILNDLTKCYFNVYVESHN